MKHNFKIIQEGHPNLLKKADALKFPLNDSEKDKITKMMTYIVDSQNEEIATKEGLRAGVGLAAPQINWLKRVFVISIDYGEEKFEEIFINPKIISHSVQKCYLSTGEGCLSVDSQITGFVERFQKISVKYYNLNGEEKQIRLQDYEAIVFQHEYDHLEGILFTSKITTDVSSLKKI